MTQTHETTEATEATAPPTTPIPLPPTTPIPAQPLPQPRPETESVLGDMPNDRPGTA